MAFVRYDMRIRDVYTRVPGLGTVYVTGDGEGRYQVETDAADQEIQDFVETVARMRMCRNFSRRRRIPIRRRSAQTPFYRKPCWILKRPTRIRQAAKTEERAGGLLFGGKMKGYRKGYRKAFQRAFPYTIPVITGLPVYRDRFWCHVSEKGYSFLWAGLMSLLVYAGSGQYLAVNFFAPGVSFLQVIFLTLMVNIRHIFYGISLLEKFHGMGKKRWYMIFGLTDETYSLLCTTKVPEDVEEDQFLLAVSLLDQSYWVIGSMIGGIAGNFLPFDSEGIDFA